MYLCRMHVKKRLSSDICQICSFLWHICCVSWHWRQRILYIKCYWSKNDMHYLSMTFITGSHGASNFKYQTIYAFAIHDCHFEKMEFFHSLFCFNGCVIFKGPSITRDADCTSYQNAYRISNILSHQCKRPTVLKKVKFTSKYKAS